MKTTNNTAADTTTTICGVYTLCEWADEAAKRGNIRRTAELLALASAAVVGVKHDVSLEVARTAKTAAKSLYRNGFTPTEILAALPCAA